MTSTDCIVQDTRTGKILGRGTERGGLYYVDEATHKGQTLLTQGSNKEQMWMWHRRLGHPSLGYLKRLFPLLNNCNETLNCEACVLVKSHKQSYFPSISRSSKPFDLIHSDVWGPAPIFNTHCFSYFVTFVDDCTRMCWVYFLKHKTEVFDVFVKFYNMLKTQFQTQPKILRSDNGKEYINQKFQDFFSTHGLIHQSSCPYTPQQNGVAERKNRTLLEITRALMFEAQTPAHFWPEALSIAAYLTNRLPTKTLQFKTPLETLRSHTSIPPSHSFPPRIFGCVVYVHLPTHTHHKLEPRAIKCVFLGYGVTQKGYRCFDPIHHKMYTTLDCDFFEDSNYYSQLSLQGETKSEDLSWLIHPFAIDHKEEVGKPTDVATDTLIPPSPPIMPILSEVSQDVPDIEVNSESICDVPVITDDSIPSPAVPSSDETCRYELPPRRTKGVPPRRYDPEFEAQRSKYPVITGENEKLTKAVVAFKASLYSNKVPRNVDEAL